MTGQYMGEEIFSACNKIFLRKKKNRTLINLSWEERDNYLHPTNTETIRNMK